MKKLILISIITFCANILNAQWNPANFPNQGEIKCIVTTSTQIFVGSGVVYLSEDNAGTWTKLSTGLPSAVSVECIGISGSNIFAGTSYSAGSSYGSVYRSTDNGSNWTEVSTGLPANQVFSSMEVIGSTVFVGTQGAGLYKTTDNGANWIQANGSNPTLKTDYIHAMVTNGSSLYAGTYGRGVFLSTDNGASWKSIGPGLTNPNILTLAISGSTLLAGTGNTGNYGGVFKSTDNGTTWSTINTGLTAGKIVYGVGIIGTRFFAGTSAGAFMSTDGSTWTSVNVGLPADTYLGQFAVKGADIYAGTEFGLGDVWKFGAGTGFNSQKMKVTGIEIYPNPNSGDFNIKTKMGGTYTIINALGQAIQIFKTDATNNYSVNISGLAGGVYFVIGDNNYLMFREKLVVSK